ncbi:MAG: SPFH domain-containing protein, partial [Anaerolineae bacterium]|nr:SPFH domain-containing protein [Anaerolineae bacterium]
MFLIITMVTSLILTAVGFTILRHLKSWVVLEDTVAITVDRNGFIKRRLPSGRHLLRPFERVDFTLETKGKLATGRVVAVTTSDGLAVHINWSGVYKLAPETITESISQRLRGLLAAEKAIARNTDIYLRKLVGSHTVRDLFNPTTRDRMERQLNQLLADRLKPLGIGFNGLNLQVIELPQEVAEAFNKAKAIETLDGVIRQLDPTTREVVRGAYQLDEILHWDAYLPTP